MILYFTYIYMSNLLPTTEATFEFTCTPSQSGSVVTLNCTSNRELDTLSLQCTLDGQKYEPCKYYITFQCHSRVPISIATLSSSPGEIPVIIDTSRLDADSHPFRITATGTDGATGTYSITLNINGIGERLKIPCPSTYHDNLIHCPVLSTDTFWLHTIAHMCSSFSSVQTLRNTT